MADDALQLDGQPLNFAQIEAVARDGLRVTIGTQALENIQQARVVVETHSEGTKAVYGINTGFGSLSRNRIEGEDLRSVQRNLIRSHAAGVGEMLPDEIVRAMLLILAASLSRGRSGVRREVVQLIVEMLNHGITPQVPSRGSVGASGDLAPLAHAGLVLIGEGQARVDGQVRSGVEALTKKGLAPITLEAKEGLALINGTHLMSAIGTLTLCDVGRLSETAIVSAATTQVLGATRDAIDYVRTVFERELGAVTDNPLVFPETNEIISGGNFHGMPLAIALDTLSIALSHIAGIAERRVYWLLKASDSENPVNLNLSPQPGLHSGLMITQYTAAALCNEIQTLATPASVANIPTSAGMEDYNSFGVTSAHQARQAVDLVINVIAIELLVMAEAMEYQRPLKSGAGVEAAYKTVRSVVPRLTEDRPPAPDIAAIARLIRAGAFCT